MDNFAQLIQDQISAHSDEKKARWLENYVKHGVQSKGVGIPTIRNIIKSINKEHQISLRSTTEQLSVMDKLMKSPFTEDQLAAILFLQLYWKKDRATELLSSVEHWLDQQWIKDWNVCDWMCVRLLSPLVDTQAETSIPVFKAWLNAKYLWKARAALVPFAQSKNLRTHQDLVITMSSSLIKREERFCKTAVGWAMRELSKHNKAVVKKFLDTHEEWLTKEVIKNASKYFES